MVAETHQDSAFTRHDLGTMLIDIRLAFDGQLLNCIKNGPRKLHCQLTDDHCRTVEREFATGRGLVLVRRQTVKYASFARSYLVAVLIDIVFARCAKALLASNTAVIKMSAVLMCFIGSSPFIWSRTPPSRRP